MSTSTSISCQHSKCCIDRFSVTSVEFAQRLHTLLAPHLPSFPYPASVKRPNADTSRKPHSCNSNIRVYKYTPSQHFGPHYDEAVRDPQTGAKSEWTLLIYLTGVEDGLQGGEVFLHDDEYGTCNKLVVILRRCFTKRREASLERPSLHL